MDEPAAVGSSFVLFYCERCGERVPAADLESAKAKKTDETHALCAQCAPQQAGANGPATGARRASERTLPPKSSSSSIPAARTVQSPSQVRHRSASGGRRTAHDKPASGLALIGAGAALMVCIGLAFLAFQSPDGAPIAANANGPSRVASTEPTSPSSGSSDTPPRDAGDRSKASSQTVAPERGEDGQGAYDPRATVAQSLLEQARQFRAECPEDPWTYREKLQELKDRYARTLAAEEAARLLAATPEPRPVDDGNWDEAEDLLAKIDPQRDGVIGQWTLVDGRLLSTNGPGHKLVLPGTPPAEYDLRLIFTRKESNECLAVNLVRDGQPVTFLLGAFGNQAGGFEMIDGKRAMDIPENRRNAEVLVNNQRYTLVLQVRKNAFRAFLNGRFYCACRASNPQFSTCGDWVFPQPDRLGIGVWHSIYEFTEVKLRAARSGAEAVAAAPDVPTRIDVQIVSSAPEPATGVVVPNAAGLQPGLYASFGPCRGDDLTRIILSRPEFNLNWDAGKGKVDPAVPADHFGILYRGLLRVPRDGRYAFSIHYNEIMKFVIGDREIGPLRQNRECVHEVELTAGDHPIRIDYFELNGSHHMRVRWKPPGEAQFRNIPQEALWHDPGKISAYKKH